MITKELIEDFVAKNGCSLKPCQPRMSVPIIQRMHSKMKAGIRFADITVYDGVIVNGHHRYIASLLAGYKVGEVKGGKPNSIATDWKLMVFEAEDWDQPEELEKINRQDAEFNEIPLDRILEITQIKV